MGTQHQPGTEPGRAGAEGAPAPAIDVWVLGPLRVFRSGAELDPGPPRSRMVLALLVSEVGRVVSVDRLIDGIWGDEPPPTAKKAVHVHISNLRRALGEDFPLRTAPGGYVVQSAGVAVDAVRFEDVAERAMRELHTDPAAASELLAESLGMWEGHAYADFGDDAALVPEITRLTELRLRSIEHRIDAELRLGRHAEVVGELETLTVDHPYRERFREFQMLALYRSGRQAEALRAYERTRTVLARELGLDPSPALQKLQFRILEHAQDLDLDESGTERYAFLATDLQDSTQLWATETDSMQGALARHDEILETAVIESSGRVFTNTDDGVLAVFAEFSDAARAAASAQARLDTERWMTDRPLRVRMAIDEGSAMQRGAEYFGPAVTRVHRMVASGHGGQVLLPATLAGRSPISTRALATVSYTGLGRIDVAQLVIDGVRSEFPELVSERTLEPSVGHGRSIRGFELRERLGEGAHGRVYRAYQASTGREFAVKMIRPELSNRTDFVKRFEAEAQFVAQLRHPNIVLLEDYWRDRYGAYLVMQLLRGGSLAESLDSAPRRLPAMLPVLDQVGVALDYAHHHGVIHGNLKPANVLLDDLGNASLADFGIATRHIGAEGVPVDGSVAYVSPEELAGLAVGITADIYGLGLLTYEMLTGDRPALGCQPAALGNHRRDLPAALDDVLARATATDPAHRYPRVDDYLRAFRQALGTDVIAMRRGAVDSPVYNPFKGLSAFTETDASDFHGREGLTEELIERVRAQRLIAVVGPSGSGKSSLVRAGLLPAVRRGVLGTRDVLITEMFPGTFPFEELEAALLRVGVHGHDGMLADLTGDDRGLVRVSKQILPDDSDLLLVIDQFEELFSMTTDVQVRRRFLANLVTAASDARGRVRVVITMRADFFDRPLAEPGFGPLLGSSLVSVAAPTRDELAAAIVRPAAAVGLEFEDGLVSRIVDDVIDQPGALPLLQYALTELVDRSRGDRLTRAGYELTGGVSGALAARAEEIHLGLTEPVQRVVREVFLRLVLVGQDTDDTRRRVRRSELDSLGLSEGALGQVLDAFGSFRLLSFDRDPVTRGPTVEVAHEALIREWPRLRTWIDERREDLLLERRLDVAVGEWQTNGSDPSYLIGGGRLQQFEQWADESGVPLTADERSFLTEARRAEDERTRATTARRRRSLVAVSAGLFVVLALAVVAVVQRNEADQQASRAEAESSRAAAAADDAETASGVASDARMVSDARLLAARASDVFEQNQDAGLLLAVAASDLLDAADRESPGVMSALFETATQHRALHRFRVERSPFPVNGPAPLPTISSDSDGERLAVVTDPRGDGGGVVEILDLETGELLDVLDQVVHPRSVYWDPFTDEVLVGRNRALASVDPATGEVTDLVVDVPGRVSVLDVTADTITYFRTTASNTGFSVPGLVEVIDRGSGELIERFLRVRWAAPSPTGDAVLVSASDWSDTGRATLETFPGGIAIPTTVPDGVFAWTAEGDLLVGRDGFLQRHRSDGTVLARVETPTVPTDPSSVAAALSPDGRWIAIEGEAGRVHVHDAETLALVDQLTLSDGVGLYDLAWAGDSRHLITVDNADEVVVWDLTDGRRAPQVAMTGSATAPVFWSPPVDGTFVGGWLDGHWESWNIETGELERRGNDDAGLDLVSVVVRPDLGLVAAPRGDRGGVAIEDLERGTTRVIADGELVMPLALSPDGSHLAVARNPIVQRFAVYEMETGALIFEHSPGGFAAFGAAFSPDGGMVVFPSFTDQGDSAEAGGFDVFDTVTGEELARVAMDGGAFWVEFAPDGRWVAVGGGRGGVELHDVDDLLAGQDSLIAGNSIAAAGLTVVSVTGDGESVVASDSFGTTASAWSADEQMTERWVLDTGSVGVGSTRVVDDLVWLDFEAALPMDADGGAFGVMGFPSDRGELADFARQKVTRELTESECRSHLASTCGEFEELIAGT